MVHWPLWITCTMHNMSEPVDHTFVHETTRVSFNTKCEAELPKGRPSIHARFGQSFFIRLNNYTPHHSFSRLQATLCSHGLGTAPPYRKPRPISAPNAKLPNTQPACRTSFCTFEWHKELAVCLICSSSRTMRDLSTWSSFYKTAIFFLLGGGFTNPVYNECITCLVHG